MRTLNFGDQAIQSEQSDATPAGSTVAQCSCGGTQFRAAKSTDGKIYLTCPTCGGVFNASAN